MPDTNQNVTVDITGNTAAIATDYINSAHFQVNKLAWGDTGEANRVSWASPLPVDIRLSTATVGITGSVSGLGNFKVINGVSSTLIVTGTTSTSYTPVQINGTIQGVTSGVLVGVTGTINVNSVTILGGSTMTLLNPIGITGGRKLSYTTDSILIQGSTVAVSSIPDLLQSKDSVRVYGAAGATLIPVTLRDGSGNSIGSSGGALNVNLVGAGITATISIGTLIGVCQANPASPFTVIGVTSGQAVRTIGTYGSEGSSYVKFYTAPTIQNITETVEVNLTSVINDTYLIKQKLDSLLTNTSNMYNTMQGITTNGEMKTQVTSFKIASSIFTGSFGLTAGAAAVTLQNQLLKTGITIKNKSTTSDIMLLGNGVMTGNYSMNPGEILFIETDNMQNIQFSILSGTGLVNYIAT